MRYLIEWKYLYDVANLHNHRILPIENIRKILEQKILRTGRPLI